MFFSSTSKLGLVSLMMFLISRTMAVYTCNETVTCPESAPCCSQYGECGTGAYCLGGCDVRFSFNLSSCMPMPRMSSFETNFTDIDSVEIQTEYLGNSSESDWVYTGWAATHDDALLLQMPKNSSGTVLSSTKYLWYGKVSATLKTSHDTGVITAFILYSDVKDEIDYEFVGYNLTSPQTNFYALGILNYTNAGNASSTDTFENWHDYELDWKEDSITWSINGKQVRVLNKADTWNETSKRYNFPQTPSRIQMSLWPGGGAGNGIGTIAWAGGAINWDSEDIQQYGYYYAYLKSVSVEAYDLPDGVKLDGSKKASEYNAFLYNATGLVNEDDVYLTNKKTWLGSNNATGFNPQNDKDPKVVSAKNKTSTIVTSSGSTKITKTTTIKDSTTSAKANVPQAMTTDVNTEAAETETTSEFTGGFVQNSKQTATSSPNSASSSGSSSNDSPSTTYKSIIGLTIGLAAGFVAFIA